VGGALIGGLGGGSAFGAVGGAAGAYVASSAAKGLADIAKGVDSATGSQLIGNLAANVVAGLGGALVGGTAGAASASNVHLYNQSMDDERQLTGESRSSSPFSQSPLDLILQGIANGLGAVLGMPGEPPTTGTQGVLVNSPSAPPLVTGGNTSGYGAGNATLSSGGDNAEASNSGNSDASLPMGSKSNQFNQPKNPAYQPTRNTPGAVDGTDYAGHAFDRMQDRGLTPSVIQNTIENGVPTPSRGGTTVFYDSVNNVSVVTNSEGKVITVKYGK
jgi:filamentous hemagglutinin